MAAPTITSISPSSGPKAGGTPVHIVGTVFTGATAVTIDGNDATMYSVVNATNILAVIPAGSGVVDVVVTTAGGSATETNGYTYTPNYTTVAKVKGRIENVSANLTDAYIEDLIYGAENIINSTMSYDFTATFDSAKHQIIENCASNIAAVQCIAFNPDPTGSIPLSESILICDLLWANIQRDLQILSDPRTLEFLKAL